MKSDQLISSVDRRATGMWKFVVFSFLAAAISGVWLRYGFWNGLPADLVYANVRHAHSHLMLYSWVTPAGMLLLFHLIKLRGGDTAGKWIVPVSVVVGFLSFVPFMLSGYSSTSVFGVRLPLSMMLSGFVVMGWWVFGFFYILNTKNIVRDTAQYVLDVALALLLLSSAGAFSLAFVGSGNFPAGLTAALVDYFIGVYSEGWLVLLVIVFVFAMFSKRITPAASKVLKVIAVLFGVSLFVRDGARVLTVLGNEWVTPLAATAQFLSGATLLALAVAAIWYMRRWSLYLIPLLFIALKGVIDAGFMFPELVQWFDGNHLKVLMLHAYLLGAVSFSIFLVARHSTMYGAGILPRPVWLLVGILVLLASLVLLTGYLPTWFPPRWIQAATISGSIAPIIGYFAARIPVKSGE